MRRDVLLEKYFSAVISGNRPMAREVVQSILDADCPAEKILSRLIWPTLEHVQGLFRSDQMTVMAHSLATRLMRQQVDQLQLRLERAEARNRRVLVVAGPDEPEELGAQMVADLLEADGYEVFFCGGGVANDEVIAQLGELKADVLVSFGAVPSTVPFTRLLIDRLHEIGSSPNLQIVLGGGVFNRAEGLAEEIGADLWAHEPEELVRLMAEQPHRRMTADQRTVGRKRRTSAA